MQILRLLGRAVSTITSAAPDCRDDEGPFFDMDFSASSVRASSSSSSGSGALSGSDSDSDDHTELEFIISMQRTHSASPQLKFCGLGPPSTAEASRKRSIRRCYGQGVTRGNAQLHA